MTTLQAKLFTIAEERQLLTLEDVRTWLWTWNLITYIRQRQAAAIVEDKVAAMDADLDTYRRDGLPAYVRHWEDNR